MAATAQVDPAAVETTLTSGAMELLNSLGDELGTLLLEAAEGFARRRIEQTGPSCSIEIGEQDVRAVGQIVMRALRQRAELESLSPAAALQLNVMESQVAAGSR